MSATVSPMKTMTNSWFSPAKASTRSQIICSELRQAGGQPPVVATIVGAPDFVGADRALDLRGLVHEVDLDRLRDGAVRLRFAGAHGVAGDFDVVQPVLFVARQHQAR